MTWISVDDQPIPKDTNSWVLDEHGGQANAYWDKRFGEWAFETFDMWYLEFPDKITHWMPLPKPPKKKEKNEQI